MSYRLGLGEVVGIRRSIDMNLARDLAAAHEALALTPNLASAKKRLQLAQDAVEKARQKILPEEVVTMARTAFLNLADDRYPEFRKSLLDVAEAFQEDVYGFVYEFQLDGPLANWCTQWNLIAKDGRPAEWALKSAYDSLSLFKFSQQFRPNPEFIWALGYGGCSPDRPALNWEGFNPVSQRLASAKQKDSYKRVRRADYSKASETLEKFLLNGWELAPTIQNDKVEWTVHCSIGGLKPKDLAERLSPGLCFDRGISKEVSKFRTLMDWPAKRGR